MLDGHIHIGDPNADRGHFMRSLHSAGFEGALVISPSPASFRNSADHTDWQSRLNDLECWSLLSPKLYPFFWIDPLEEDAERQIDTMSDRVAGFKVICNRFYPSDERAMKVFRHIASLNKPILFHSGILWDTMDSARYNRPGEFECLLEAPGLKFALAHISWPWCDECIAVYGKLLNAHRVRPEIASEMFIDMTPGTPPIYRREVLTKLFTVGYDVQSNVIFGSDGCVDSYDAEWVGQWIKRDNDIYSELGISEEARKLIFGGNLLRFLGLDTAQLER